jgi:GT2 family glycosyltransferase
MSDEVALILRESTRAKPKAASADRNLVPPKDFDEAGYLRINPDVLEAIARGEVASAYEHYLKFGAREGRALPGAPVGQRNRLIRTAPHQGAPGPASADIRHSIECLVFSLGGGLMIVGWVDDSHDPIDCIQIKGNGWKILIDGAQLVRLRRTDVENELGARSHPYGFFGFLTLDGPIPSAGPVDIEIWLRSDRSAALRVPPRLASDVELRDIALTYLATGSFFGNAAVEGIACLDRGMGGEILRFNLSITARMLTSPYVERFGPTRRRLQGSLIVCLYGKAEFLFLQSCLYAGLPGIDDYEFIYVSNSPELGETLLREARSAHQVYGLPITVVILAGNAGFGGANNAAAKVARSRRVMAVNPDVFPRDPLWAKKHTDLIGAQPADRTRLFGVPLYYDDGSLMHGGAYFELDIGLSLANGTAQPYQMARVEHYGKGAPEWAPRYTRARPVPAVTGAFISAEASWFEKLGGFTEDYVFGHYEDADLCLKSIQAGTLPWLHDLRMWHLEGKGSTRLPQHEGGSLVNRWLFSRNWSATIDAGFRGQAPSEPGFEAAAPLSGGGEAAVEPSAPAAPLQLPPRPKATRAAGKRHVAR